MRVFNVIFILVALLFSSCAKTEYEKKRDLENKIIGQTWRQLEKEKNLIPVGEGGSITPGKEFIGLYFQYCRPLTIDEARELVVYAAETFLHNLNSNEQLNQMLKKPYLMSWIEIRIFLCNPDYSEKETSTICLVHFKKNKIIYLTENRNDFDIIYEETCEEALKKLK